MTPADVDMDTAETQTTNNLVEFNQAVLDAIEKHNTQGSRLFSSPDMLMLTDIGELLRILMVTRLGSCEMDTTSCDEYIHQHRSLGNLLQVAYAGRSFAELLENPDMPDGFLEGSLSSPADRASSCDNSSLKAAFEEPYIGAMHQVLIETLNKERVSYSDQTPAETAYNWAISVVQSSGTGKSRMVDQAAKTMFTIPINLREDLGDKSGMAKTFPPPDVEVRQYFEDRIDRTDEQQKADFAVLLRVLFDKVHEMVQEHWPELKGIDLAEGWAKYLRHGMAGKQTGENRRKLYAAVVHEAAHLRNSQGKKNKTLEDLQQSLRDACGRLAETVHPHRAKNTNAFFVYFDEAHPLTKIGKPSHGTSNRSVYHNLGTVLSTLTSKPAFFIFLSTNSRMEDYTPPPHHHPSFRVHDGSQLVPPFNELPFDLYENQVLDEIGPLTLENLSKTKVVVGFGRPLWHAQYHADSTAEVFNLAMGKLSGSGVKEKESDAQIAALGVRIGITFDVMHTSNLALQSRLIESHMRVVYSIPRHRNYMHTGSPSEPVLAEAAGRYFDSRNQHGLPKDGPRILANKCDEWSIARGERGELAGRLLVMSAYDIALKKYFSENPEAEPRLDQPRFHYPISLLSWIRALFGQNYRHVLDAKPVSSTEGSKTLEAAFPGSYLFFSHFALASDKEMLSGVGLVTALMRGMAIQAKEIQPSIDAVIPIHMGPLGTPISLGTTSAINLQFKNRKQAADCHIDRTITVPDAAQSTISIIFELGVNKDRSGTIKIIDEPHPITRGSANKDHPDDNHYEIVVSGCDSTTFGAIPPETEMYYKTILGGGTVEEDFPRIDTEANLSALYQMNPSFSGVRQKIRHSKRFST